ncbi:hypothetical protein A2715_01840 [Candidatus Woesebacteria bacterium RIFCSPHIGHO2_01_FULL_39_32]|uniref:RimK domain protein ATP-grasp n=2 Tax=Candidatus Woeseibacteriota TaxID=1752722 RepID=A0A0G0PRP8_9BACT|nr:MAG: RimK domain protein ATP-grasp [Candidatus Woesebacteria bacterium GW2011_GWA1_39_8]OGM03633.1 MAG: hypothetical protein A2124_00545 [Candidatus Woesebacteria bacterium GWB1_37_5]OGM23900.1 MAG: hypothetical protein A2715_01840 [Candidatus Woesebacteria bacterium RIFCSPHIGHO2_01_FULL_39_32]OGM38636.1 MAG: hypothetical protein A3F01_02690 [Candidatus Woesebacteria bacterium RIFCSPHIGHO2_12_FULL_38_11]OGM64089.1 MAG: hypothetical protein A2893_03080 [Candidatus Woesebacteria bacterium RIFC
MAKGFVLIVSSKPDPHVDKVVKYLRAWSIPFYKLETNNLIKSPDIRFSKINKTSHYSIFDKELEISLSDIRSVWFRKPYFGYDMINNELKVQQALSERYKIDEFRQVCNTLLIKAEENGIFVVSPYNALNKAKYKILQLDKAFNIGLSIPDTLVSTRYDEIEKFCSDHDGQMIIKVLGKPEVTYGKKSITFQTYLVSIDKFREYYKKREVDYPFLVQEKIEKSLELRITIIGNQIFPCAIYSQENKNAKLDWTKANPFDIPHKEYKLPKDIIKKCFNLCKHFKLQFGAIDMAVTPEGKYVFFEINPNGQYLWIEHLTKLPLSEAMSNLLVYPERYALK